MALYVEEEDQAVNVNNDGELYDVFIQHLDDFAMTAVSRRGISVPSAYSATQGRKSSDSRSRASILLKTSRQAWWITSYETRGPMGKRLMIGGWSGKMEHECGSAG